MDEISYANRLNPNETKQLCIFSRSKPFETRLMILLNVFGDKGKHINPSRIFELITKIFLDFTALNRKT